MPSKIKYDKIIVKLLYFAKNKKNENIYKELVLLT